MTQARTEPRSSAGFARAKTARSAADTGLANPIGLENKNVLTSCDGDRIGAETV